MKEITTIIIDDEEHNRNVLKILLNKYCPALTIIAEASCVDEAYSKINTLNPKLVFLDIKMPDKNGFDLLKMFNEVTFEVVFVSAFDEFAITAFDFNALGYILKPIDYHKLIHVVDKVIEKINLKQTSGNIMDFIKTVGGINFIDKISVHHGNKVVFVKITDIVSVNSDGNVCLLNLISEELYYSNKDLKQFESILSKFHLFIRISKSVIINLSYVKSYSKGVLFEIEMLNGVKFEVSRRKKTEVLSKMKSL